jgi:hypothetical protein
MADEIKETAIFEIDLGDSLEKLADLRDQITAYKAQQKLLADEIRNGNASAGKAYEELGVTVRSLTAEQRGLTRQVDGYTRARKEEISTTNFASNSIKQNRELLKQLKEQIISIKNPTEAQVAAVRNLTQELIKQESAIGVTARNVGNYGNQLNTFGSSMKGAIASQLGFNAALSANPVGAIIQLITQLTKVFSTNAEFADKVKFAMEGVNAAFRVAIDLIVNSPLFKALMKLFTDPKQAIIDLGKLIQENLINRVKAFGVIVQAVVDRDFKKLADGFIQLSTGVADATGKLQAFGTAVLDAAEAGSEASRQLDALVVSNQKIDNEIRKNEQSVKALTFALKDRTKSEQERIKIATEIADLEVRNADLQEKKAKELLAAEKLRLGNAKLSAEEQAKLSKLDTDIAIAESDKRIANSQRETRINILLEREARQEKVEDLTAYYAQIDKLFDDFTLNERQKLEKSFADKLSLIKGESEKEIELRKTILQAQADALEAFDNAALQKAIKADTERNLQRLQEQLIQLELAGQTTIEKEIELELARREALLAEQEITEEKRALIIAESEKRIKGINDKATQEELQQAQANAEVRIQIEAALVDTLGNIATIFGEQSEQFAAFQKALTLFEIGLSTAKAISQAITAVRDIPFPGNIAAIVVSVGTVVANIATAVKAFKKAGNPPKAPKFADGGAIPIHGKPHSRGGEVVTIGGRAVAEVEGGEGLFVMKKTAFGAIQRLSRFNQKYGGRSWSSGRTSYAADGGLIGDGGFANRQFSQSAQIAELTQNIIRETLQNAPVPVLSITELNSVQSDRERAVGISEI